MAFRISFFHTPKHRVFDYKPLYWDPKKEELEERVQKTRSLVAAQRKTRTNPMSREAPSAARLAKATK